MFILEDLPNVVSVLLDVPQKVKKVLLLTNIDVLLLFHREKSRNKGHTGDSEAIDRKLLRNLADVAV